MRGTRINMGKPTSLEIREALNAFPTSALRGNRELYTSAKKKVFNSLSIGAQEYVLKRRRQLQNCKYAKTAQTQRKIKQQRSDYLLAAYAQEVLLYRLKDVTTHVASSWHLCINCGQFLMFATEIRLFLDRTTAASEEEANGLVEFCSDITVRIKRAFEDAGCFLNIEKTAARTGMRPDGESLVLSQYPDGNALIVYKPKSLFGISMCGAERTI